MAENEIFKRGDRVECVDATTRLTLGEIYTVKYVDSKYLGFEELHDKGTEWRIWRFKLLTNKPKTTKEEDIDPEELCDFCEGQFEDIRRDRCEGCSCSEAVEMYLEENQTTEEVMSTSININSTVAKVFPNSIEDAKLVTKFFGSEYDETSFRDFMYLRDNAEEVLKEANDRQKEEDLKK